MLLVLEIVVVCGEVDVYEEVLESVEVCGELLCV